MIKTFIFKCFVFISPFLVFILLIELFLFFSPNSFNLKYNWLKNNNNVECVFLGSSHTQNSINPEFIKIKAVNLAYGGQDFKLDSALFFKTVPKLRHLKRVFVEIDYHSLYYENKPDYFRNIWYSKYYGINCFSFPWYKKYFLYFSSPSFFNSYILNYLNPQEFKYNLNKYGFITNDLSGDFEDLKYDYKSIEVSFKTRYKTRHKENSLNVFYKNKRRILSIINYCFKHNINICILKNPVYKSYRNNYILSKNNMRNIFIDSLGRNSKVEIYDFERSKLFTIYDFKNDDHLNSDGAKKLTRMINALNQ